ncbi:uncharacterized protein [Eurosta solidaginis]|uniref:uncharacterized protein n=1 Tax=Eurosta solidaginis TaxID=178769 RepID=UPI003530D951
MSPLKASSTSAMYTLVVILLFITTVCADLLVQINVNRPFNDVNEKFVSFTVEPEDLYKALDGPNRKTSTQMATLLGSSFIKFSNDYNFIPDVETKYRNPTKTLWKGFNRWTSAVNWTMIVPVPYTAGEWDPMEALRILNSSYTTGMTDCIWQLGTDFGPSVSEYLNDLKTLSLMVDTFNPYVDDWEITGAEIPSSSSNEEIKRFIELSKDMSAAFNWKQPADMSQSIPLIGSVYDLDRPLRAMLNEKVPVWLNFVSKEQTKKSKQKSSSVGSNSKTNMEDINEVLHWAQTLGEAASSGFDVVFRRINQDDLEYPSPSFYATMLFKKLMGSRVFPARPFTIFLRTSKVYTHCANTISGGIAFMIVNTDDEQKQVSIRSTTKLPGEEYWEYIMTFKKTNAYLNNEKLSINSTLTPEIKTKSANKALQLNTPGQSIGFWVLPNAEVEHCQFTEIDIDELEPESEEEKVIHKRHSSADKLLQQLIQSTALSNSAPTKSNHRGRRYATHTSRVKHVVLENNEGHMQTLAKLFEPLSLEEKPTKKREEALKDRRAAALKWIKELLDTAMQERDDLFPLKRNTRSVDNYFGNIFGPRGSRKPKTVVKKITEIRKPEKKSIKPTYDPDHFDEEDFFKKMGVQNEPDPPRVPDGDVHLTQISNIEGEEVDDSEERDKKKTTAKKIQSSIGGKETRNELKPLRLLPTEFYEALPIPTIVTMRPNKLNSWNALWFPEPFTKKSNKDNVKPKSNELDEATQKNDADSEVEKIIETQFQNGGQLAEDFLHAQEELARSFLQKYERKDDSKKLNKNELSSTEVDNEDNNTAEKIKTLRSKYIDYLAENLERYFTDHGLMDHDMDNEKNAEHVDSTTTTESTWWDLSSLRKRRSPRALHYPLTEDAWLSNMITKDEDLMPLGSVAPAQLAENERKITNKMNKDDDARNPKSNGYLRTVKDRVDKVVGIVTQHVNNWYNTFAKPLDDVTTDIKENRSKNVVKGKRRL